MFISCLILVIPGKRIFQKVLLMLSDWFIRHCQVWLHTHKLFLLQLSLSYRTYTLLVMWSLQTFIFPIISARLTLTPHTVFNHIKNVMAKDQSEEKLVSSKQGNIITGNAAVSSRARCSTQDSGAGLDPYVGVEMEGGLGIRGWRWVGLGVEIGGGFRDQGVEMGRFRGGDGEGV